MSTFQDTEKKTLLLLCSDHGMNDRGNHGGASDEEISTPFVFMKSDARKWPFGEFHTQFLVLYFICDELDITYSGTPLLGQPLGQIDVVRLDGWSY